MIKFQIAIPQRLFIASRASKYMLEGKSETFGKHTNFCHYWFIETTNDGFQHINSIIYFIFVITGLLKPQMTVFNILTPLYISELESFFCVENRHLWFQ